MKKLTAIFVLSFIFTAIPLYAQDMPKNENAMKPMKEKKNSSSIMMKEKKSSMDHSMMKGSKAMAHEKWTKSHAKSSSMMKDSKNATGKIPEKSYIKKMMKEKKTTDPALKEEKY